MKEAKIILMRTGQDREQHSALEEVEQVLIDTSSSHLGPELLDLPERILELESCSWILVRQVAIAQEVAGSASVQALRGRCQTG